MHVGLKPLKRRLLNRKERRLYFAVIIRVSSNKQGNVLHGSLEQQNHFIDTYIKNLEKQLNCKIVVSRRIEEEINGREDATAHRYELHKLLKLMEGNLLDGIIFEKLDRISRDQEFNIRLLKTAHKWEYAIIQVNKGFIDLNNRSDRLSVNMENFVAEEYHFELKEKVQKKTRAARLNNGKDSQTVAVLGLDPHPTQTGFYVINKEKQKIVTEIYSPFAKTASYTKVIEYCREKGYQRKSRMSQWKVVKGQRVPPRMIGGGPITRDYLYYLLRNQKIRAIGSFKDTWEQYPDQQNATGKVRYRYSHEPVVSPELIAQVDAVLEKLSKEHIKCGKMVYLLSGILVTNDGKRLYGVGGNNVRNGRYRYYTNTTLKYRIPKDEIEALIVKRIKHYLTYSDTVQ